ncbi:MAG: hypothetical protein AABX65_02615, partial [Nanoarchaeota archaeon]
MIEEILEYALENAEKQLERDAVNLQLFSWIYRMRFEGANLTFENGQQENIYYFSDNSGGYTAN